MFYEYTSAFANNGSGFEGLADDSLWWNLTAVIALILGRYLPLMIAGQMACKRVSPESAGSLRAVSGWKTPPSR